MGNQRMQEDNIKYVVSAETDKAQQEIHKLTQDIKSLTKEERARRQAMIELEAQGKKNTDEYRNLQKEAKELSDKIKDNNKQVNDLTKKVDINGMSMVQLKKRAKELQTQLDNTSKALNPQEYTRTEQALNQVKNRMGELKTNGQSVSSEMGAMVSWMGKLKAAAIAFVTVKLAEYLKDITMKAYDTRKEFAQYEAVLRNTLGSQEKAADAMNRLQRLAADTPFSLKEWTEGYIKLVNRGIKPTNEELTNMGDIAASQGKTLDQFVEALLDAMTGENERMKEFGIRANAQGDKVKYTFKGVTTEVAKSDDAIVKYILSLGKLQGVSGSMSTQMEELGGMASNLGDNMDAFFNKVGKKLEPFFKGILSTAGSFFTTLSSMLTSSTEKYEDHYNKMVQVESALSPLLSRYSELILKTSRSAAENKELSMTIQNISKLIPGAATAFDRYGNAIAISTTKVKEFLKNQRDLLAFENKKAIEDTKKQIDQYQKQLDNLKAQQKQGGATRFTPGGMFGGSIAYIDKTVMSDIEANIAKTSEMLNGAKQSLAKLNGQTIEDGINAQKEEVAARNKFNKMTKNQLDKWIADEKNASTQYIDIAKEVAATKNNSNVKADTSDPYAVALKKLESGNEAQINEIRLAGREKQQSEFDIESNVLLHEESYYKKRISMLQKFSETAKKADKRAEYEKQVVDAKTKLLDIEEQKEKLTISELQRLRDGDLAKEEEITKAQQVDLANRLGEKKISQEEYNALMLSLDTSSAETRLAIQKRYLNDASDLEIKNSKLKEDTVKAANKNVSDAEQSAATARVKSMQYMNDMLKSFKEEFKLTTVDEDIAAQQKVLDAAYKARKLAAEKENADTTELDKAYTRAKEQLEFEHQQKIASIRDQFGLSTEKEKYDLQLANLKNALDQQMLTQEDYEKAVQNLKRDSYKKQFDYYNGLFSGAVNALQQAEMDNVDAKYDAEIAAAKGNSEEVERLENEKEKKKLEVQKKYADINFAIKASQIVADTAVSIMKAYADLGPIAGTVAAALLGITGVAQLMSANAERQKVKNMTVAGSSSSNSSGSRVATGRESGGYVDVEREQDGKKFNAKYDPDKRGYVDRPTVIVGEGPNGQSKEWVASNAAVNNPTIAPILDMIDRSQRAGTIRTLDLNAAMKARMAGYASGGRITPSVSSSTTPTIVNSGMSGEQAKSLTDAINNLVSNGVPASVVLTDLERKQQLRDRARKIGSKK